MHTGELLNTYAYATHNNELHMYGHVLRTLYACCVPHLFVDRRMGGWIDGWVGGWVCGRASGWMDGRVGSSMGRSCHVLYSASELLATADSRWRLTQQENPSGNKPKLESRVSLLKRWHQDVLRYFHLRFEYKKNLANRKMFNFKKNRRFTDKLEAT